MPRSFSVLACMVLLSLLVANDSRLGKTYSGTERSTVMGVEPIQPRASILLGDIRRNPIIALVISRPLTHVIGSESPRFVAYDDGLVLWGDESSYRCATLATNELSQLVNDLSIADLQELDEDYIASDIVDSDLNTIHSWGCRGHVATTVKGDLSNGLGLMKTPRAFVTAFIKMSSYRAPCSVPWLPEEMEILLQPVTSAPKDAYVWPEYFPRVNSSDPLNRKSYHAVMLDVFHFQSLRSNLRARSDSSGAIIVDGRPFGISWRVAFPLEERWLVPSERKPIGRER